MNTTIHDDAIGISATRFFGGAIRGVCVALHNSDRSLTVEASQVPRLLELIDKLVCIHCGAMQPEGRCCQCRNDE